MFAAHVSGKWPGQKKKLKQQLLKWLIVLWHNLHVVFSVASNKTLDTWCLELVSNNLTYLLSLFGVPDILHTT